jgi:hypothetical protein
LLRGCTRIRRPDRLASVAVIAIDAAKQAHGPAFQDRIRSNLSA